MHTNEHELENMWFIRVKFVARTYPHAAQGYTTVLKNAFSARCESCRVCLRDYGHVRAVILEKSVSRGIGLTSFEQPCRILRWCGIGADC